MNAIGYNLRNACERDKYITFDPDAHSYTVRGAGGDVECLSVTQLVGGCFEQFDADHHAARLATPECPAEVLKARWAKKGEEARIQGTLLHERIERHFLGLPADSEALAERAFRQFLDFAASRTIEPYRSEWAVYSEKYRLAGTIDFLAFDGKKYEIYDWKRSTKVVGADGRPLETNYGRYGRKPIDNVPDTVFYHYSLQLSLYRYLLKAEYGIEVSACHLGIFHPLNNQYFVVDTPYLRHEVEALLNERL